MSKQPSERTLASLATPTSVRILEILEKCENESESGLTTLICIGQRKLVTHDK